MEKIETNVIKPEIAFIENDVDNLLINKEEEYNLDSSIENVELFIKNNSGKGKSEEEKNELYNTSQQLWKVFFKNLQDAKYNFYLNRPQYMYLTNLLMTKMEYDVNTVFFAIELTNTLGNMKKNSNYLNDTDIIPYSVNATEITYIYHLISGNKVKGLTKDAYIFSQILVRIGSISKIINYYEAVSKRLSNDITNWVCTFEDGVSLDSFTKPQDENKEEEGKQEVIYGDALPLQKV